MIPELEVKHLKVAFGANGTGPAAVNGIGFELYAGETLAIVGESGCGKTVTALSVLRLIPDPPGKILEGEILFRSRDLLRLSEKEMRDLRGNDIAMIFQEPMTSLNPVFTIGGQIAETLLRHTALSRRQARVKTVELLSRVELPAPAKKLDVYPHQLSGGMRQRVMIAMALACGPRVLIADEPTTALDVLIQAQILNLLDHIKRETGMAVLIITHNLGVVARIAQRVLVMYAGEIVESGPVKALLQTPLHPYTLGLMNSIPRPGRGPGKRERLTEIKGNVPTSRVQGCAFHPRCPAAMDRCRIESPTLREITPGHRVSCWLDMA